MDEVFTGLFSFVDFGESTVTLHYGYGANLSKGTVTLLRQSMTKVIKVDTFILPLRNYKFL